MCIDWDNNNRSYKQNRAFVEGSVRCWVRRGMVLLGSRYYFSRFLEPFHRLVVLVKGYAGSDTVHVFGLDGFIMCCADFSHDLGSPSLLGDLFHRESSLRAQTQPCGLGRFHAQVRYQDGIKMNGIRRLRKTPLFVNGRRATT